MAKIENPKAYTGADLETIFFRPMLTGESALDLGVKIMYNMPVPTTLQFWKRAGDILQKYTQHGWNGGSAATKYQKLINLSKVKAEVGYSADDYFNMVYELMVTSSQANMQDLSGTELEVAETALFKEAIAESIRATMWLGCTSRPTTLNTFDGFVKRIIADTGLGEDDVKLVSYSTPLNKVTEPDAAETLLKRIWDNSSPMLKEFKSQGNLVYLVTSDIYAKYEEELENVILESSFLAKQNGREGISYRGIPVIDLKLSAYTSLCREIPSSFAILTDRRNLALAVNTSDFPGTEVKMWYNPDEMQNRQRAVFMAGCDYLLPELVSLAVGGFVATFTPKQYSATGGDVMTVDITGVSVIKSVTMQSIAIDGVTIGSPVAMVREGDIFKATSNGTGVKGFQYTLSMSNDQKVVITAK